MRRLLAICHEVVAAGYGDYGDLEAYLGGLDPEVWSRDSGVRNQGEVLTIRDTVEDLVEDYGHHAKQLRDWAV